MNETVIEINNLKKSFSNFKALQGINLKVKKGEIIGLLGPNGAGKSTTIKVLTGLLKADSGNVKIMGEKIKRELPVWIKEKIAVVFEESNLYSRLNAVDNLSLFAGINNIDSEKIDMLLSEFQLQDSANKEVKTFSKGMKKRLMICRALLSDPEILILDEATGGLDPISAEIIRKKVLGFKKDSKTVILSTHYLEEADRLCDKVAFINRGKVIAFDQPSVFKEQFSNRYLKIKLVNDQKLTETEIRNYLLDRLSEADNYFFESDNLILELKISSTVLKKAAEISEKFNFADLDKVEADLQKVFNNINN